MFPNVGHIQRSIRDIKTQCDHQKNGLVAAGDRNGFLSYSEPGGLSKISEFEKPRRRAAFSSNLCPDQATRSPGPLRFRRYAKKPTPAKPKTIIAQVEGSGTAPTGKPPRVPSWRQALFQIGRLRLAQSNLFFWPRSEPSALYRVNSPLSACPKPDRKQSPPKGCGLGASPRAGAVLAIINKLRTANNKKPPEGGSQIQTQ